MEQHHPPLPDTHGHAWGIRSDRIGPDTKLHFKLRPGSRQSQEHSYPKQRLLWRTFKFHTLGLPLTPPRMRSMRTTMVFHAVQPNTAASMQHV